MHKQCKHELVKTDAGTLRCAKSECGREWELKKKFKRVKKEIVGYDGRGKEIK